MSTDPEDPGQVLRNWIAGHGWNQKILAEVMGRPAQWVSEVCSGKKSITVLSASELAAAFDNTPGFWLAMQDRYRLWVLAQNKPHNRRLAEIRERAEALGRRDAG